VPLGNILRDFVDSDDDDESDIENEDDNNYPVRAVDILLNFDSDSDRVEEVYVPEIDSTTDVEEEEEGEDDDESSHHSASGSIVAKPGRRYTESDFSFLKEEWLRLTIESSEDEASDDSDTTD
jgi:hypothetical protein